MPSIGPSARRQDGAQVSLQEMYLPVMFVGGEPLWPEGAGYVALSLASACMNNSAGDPALGTWEEPAKYPVAVGPESMSAYFTGHHSPPYQPPLPDYFMSVGGSGIARSGALKFEIPELSEGEEIIYASITLTGDKGTTRTIWVSPTSGAEFIFELPFIGSPTPWSGVVPPSAGPGTAEWSVYWACPGYESFSGILTYLVGNIPAPPCTDLVATVITDSGAILSSVLYPTAHWWYGIEGSAGTESEDGILTGLTPDTWYWYWEEAHCPTTKKWFKTKKYEDPVTHNITVVTLGVDDYWWMGGGIGTVRGLIKHTGTMGFYGYFGFQFGTSSDFTDADTYWMGNLGWESGWVPSDPYMYPFQQVHNHLLPDRTYYYRAIWHHHRPPYTVDLYGETKSFSGVNSILGFGTNHVTAKKAEDDISKLAAGRYYMDKSGILQYESYQRRLV